MNKVENSYLNEGNEALLEDIRAGTADFEAMGEYYGAALEEAFSSVLGGDSGEAVAALRDYADEHGVSISDAFLIRAAESDDKVDARIADAGLRTLLLGDLIKPPVSLIRDDTLEDRIYERISAVADALPDSRCSVVFELIQRYDSIDADRVEIEDRLDRILEEETETGPLLGVYQEYQTEIAAIDAKLDILKDDISVFREELSGPLGSVSAADKYESEILSSLLIAESRPGDSDFRPAGEIEQEIREYVEVHPDSPLAGAMELRQEVQSLDRDVLNDVTGEAIQRLQDKFQEYRNSCDAVIFGTTETLDAGNDVTRDNDAASHRDTQAPDVSTMLSDLDAVKADYSEALESVKSYSGAESVVTNTEKNPVEPNEPQGNSVSFDTSRRGVDLPENIRADADAVVTYASAERLYAHHEDYTGFAVDGSDLISTVYAARDDLERMADDGGEVSREFVSILNELDVLGDKNGEAEHDARIDELTARKEELTLFAGAVISNSRNDVEHDQEDAIWHFHRTDMELRHNPDNTDALADIDVLRDSLRTYSEPGSPDKDGPAARYQDSLQRCEVALSKLRPLEAQAEKDPLNMELAEKIADIRYERDAAQRVMDLKFHEIEICREGTSAFGTIDLPVEKVEKQDVEGVSNEMVVQPEEDTRSAYEVAKEKYEDIKDRYLFRNTFTCAERLTFDVEAYKTGEDGSKGRPVSGGDIAMDVLDLFRSNIFESIIEIAVREYYDKKYPAVEKDVDPVDRENEIHIGREDHADDYARDYAGLARDDGWIGADFDASGHPTDNPGTGHYMGADLTKELKFNDISLHVYNCAPKNVDFTATTGRVDNEGRSEAIRVPPIRLVVSGESMYLVDPFGQALRSNVTTDARDAATNERIALPYFKELDISASKGGADRIAACAQNMGVSVEECKTQIVERSKQGYVDRGLEEIQKHGAYIEDRLIPESMNDISDCRERIAYLETVKTAIEDRVANPTGYDTAEDTERFKSILPAIDTSIETLAKLESGLTTRVEQLVDTVKMYRDVGEICRSATDIDSKFLGISRAESTAAGKIDNPYYGVTVTDMRSVDTTLEACGFDSDQKMWDVAAGRGWPEESDVAFGWSGAILNTSPQHVDEQIVALREELRDHVSIPYPDFAQRWPGLEDTVVRPDFDIDKFDIKSALREMGVIQDDPDKLAQELRDKPMTENEDLERLGLYQYVTRTDAENDDFLAAQFDAARPPLERIPSPEEIERARDDIGRFAYGAKNADGFGLREVGPDFDWNTVRPREVIKDGNMLWVRPDGVDHHVLMTTDQASAVMHGPLAKEDVSHALDRYFSISRDSSSTFDFSVDFLDINKYRVTPDTVLEAYGDKLRDFVSGNKEEGAVDAYSVDVMADCLASVKEQIVSCFADAVVDKIEAIVNDAVSNGDDDRVEAFIDHIVDSFEPIIDRVMGFDIDLDDVQLTEEVADRLEALSERGLSPESIEHIANVARTIDAIFAGYSEGIKLILEESGEKVDLGVAADEEQDVDRGVERDTQDDDLGVIMEETADAVDEVLSGLDDISGYDEDDVEHQERDVETEDDDTDNDYDRVD